MFYKLQVLILACDDHKSHLMSASIIFLMQSKSFQAPLIQHQSSVIFPYPVSCASSLLLVPKLSRAITLVSWKLRYWYVTDCVIRDSRFLWQPALLNPKGQRRVIYKCYRGKKYPQFETLFLSLPFSLSESSFNPMYLKELRHPYLRDFVNPLLIRHNY